jgi:hypothetical protein
LGLYLCLVQIGLWSDIGILVVLELYQVVLILSKLAVGNSVLLLDDQVHSVLLLEVGRALAHFGVRGSLRGTTGQHVVIVYLISGRGCLSHLRLGFVSVCSSHLLQTLYLCGHSSSYIVKMVSMGFIWQYKCALH